jgi:dimethylhistidine N-methyltransferase
MRVHSPVSLADEIRRGLSDPVQKWLPAKGLYDDVGSALFEAITALPEYGLTRADIRLLRQASSDIAVLTKAGVVVELGSGSGIKTRTLLAGFGHNMIYRPIDVSRAALERCRCELSEFDVRPVHGEFLPGLRESCAGRDSAPVLAAFLGSNIGNLQRPEIPNFLRSVRDELRAGDWFLLGIDLIKPVQQVLPAYDDAAGVTAAFNRNLLARINREFHANFEVRCFDHEVRWHPGERRIEMHLRARSAQTAFVRALALEVRIGAGETIWTEASHKFEIVEIESVAGAAGFRLAHRWADEEWPFAELLLEAI